MIELICRVGRANARPTIAPHIWNIAVGLALLASPYAASTLNAEDAPLLAGFAEADITPKVGDKDKPVYIAGFGQNRKATAVHGPLKVRAIVLQQGERKIALASVDLIGFFNANV